MKEHYGKRAEFIGTIAEQIIVDAPYEIIQKEGELLYKVILHVQRKSGMIDKITVFADKKELRSHKIGKGLKVSIEGEVRTYNEYEPLGKVMHVITYVRATRIRRVHNKKLDKNIVIMEGHLTKTPKYWKSLKGRSKVDFCLCTRDSQEGKLDFSFVPCIARDALAEILCELSPREELSFEGELRSRQYIRNFADGTKECRTAFEVVVNQLI